MILLDFNNKASITYSVAISMVLEDEKKVYKKTGTVPTITNHHYNLIRKAFFNLVLKDLQFLVYKHASTYGELVVCCDYDKSNYWRKEIYKHYKANRDAKKTNEFDAISGKMNYEHKSEMLELFRNMGVKVVDKVQCNYKNNPNASVEADEIIAVLSRYPGKHMIISSDGDFAQCTSDKVKHYNPSAKKIVNYTKKEINEKNLKSLLLGQAKDNIESIKYNSEISDDFIKWMNEKYNIEITKEMIFILVQKYSKYMDEYRLEKNMEDEKEITDGKRKQRRNLSAFAKPNFGEVAYKKLIDNYSLDEILDMNVFYKARYKMNELLYYLDRVPQEIVDAINFKYSNLNTKENIYEAQSFCMMNSIEYIKL